MNTNYEFQKCTFVSSFGIATGLKQSPLMSKNGARYNLNFNNTYGETIYIRIVDVVSFFKQCADQFKEPFILVTGDMDTTVPDDIPDVNSILNHPKLLKWYAQNYSKSIDHPKLSWIPIGLDYHTLYLTSTENNDWGKRKSPMEQEADLIQIKNSILDIKKINPTKAVTNFHLSTYGYPARRQQYREPILNALKDKDCIVWLPKQTRNEFWKSCGEYAFVICPFGNGLDTHRTWETLCLGRIPIVPKSKLNKVFEGLPIVEVEDKEWSVIDKEWLVKKYEEIMSQWDSYNFNRLTLKYWLNKIKN
jgi:hypothetical protein